MIACANCLQKQPNIEKKKPKRQNNFFTPTASKKAKFVRFGIKKANLAARDDHYPVCRLDIRQDSEFATG